MIRLVLVLTIAALFATAPAFAQPKAAGPELPVNRIVLFSSGVGYFQREGQVDGNGRVDLQFHLLTINDLLKSLVLQDLNGGQVGAVSYDNRDPLYRKLKSFALDLTGNPTLAELLNQARGEKIELVTDPEKAKDGQSETITGLIVGVEHERQPAAKEVVEVALLNVLTADGLRSIPLSRVRRVKFLKPQLDDEFRKALEVLATGHDTEKKTVSVSFTGTGKRTVRLAYVTESPIWKTSYRLALNGKDEKKSREKLDLQGWAIIENTTDDDWNNVRLGLVSGRPISFQMDLYNPLFMTRPVVEPELFASLRPPNYQATMTREDAGRDAKAPVEDVTAGLPPRDGERKPEAASAMLAETAKQAVRGLDKKATSLRFEQGVASTATSTDLGEFFEYVIEKPVNLPRQKSALLPIINQPVEGAKVSIYNQAVHAKFPLLGLRFTNSTPLHLTQGPVTVFENDAYAGDARFGDDVKPGETRLISYAIDLGTEVAPEVKNPVTDLLTVKIYKGILHATRKTRLTHHYTVKNRSKQTRTVLIEQPINPSMTLVSPARPTEKTRDLYRFELEAEPYVPVVQDVVEEQVRVDQTVLTNSNDDQVAVFIQSNASSPKVKEALAQALKLKHEMAQTTAKITVEERALAVIEKDQARMRANMERVPQTSEAYKRYLKKFDDQETEIEKRRAELVKQQETADAQRKAYESFLLGLTVE